ncbi:MAG: hypothetical protein E7647_02790 [Ruminococcaceae bacterium]|nr:hypothetical protein [Oscillospiraceae bacterium]
MKYFRVRAKCGHVGGRKSYIDIDFYTVADNGQEAARLVRMAPRVKHHHKDAIRFVEEISPEEYLKGRAEYTKDPFVRCKNKQQQEKVMHLILPRIMKEDPCKGLKLAAKKGSNPKRSLKFGYLKNKKLSLAGYVRMMDLDYAL